MGAVEAPETPDTEAPLPRGPRLLGMSGGTLLTAAFVMPVAQVCDKVERGYELGFDWGGVTPGYLFGLVVLAALVTLAIRGEGLLGNVTKALRLYLTLWTLRVLLMFTSGIWKDFIADGKPFEVMSVVGALLAMVPLLLIRATFVKHYPLARTFGRMMWLGGVLWIWWIALGIDHGIENLYYGFWVTIAGVALIAAGGVMAESELARVTGMSSGGCGE